MSLLDHLNDEFFGNPLRAWGLALLFSVASFTLLRLVLALIIRRWRAHAVGTVTRMDDLVVELLAATRNWFLFFGALYLGTKPLHLPVALDQICDRTVILVLVLQSAIWGNSLIQFGLENYFKRRAREDTATATTIGLISAMSRALLYLTLTLVALNNFGVNVTALVAGLGVGGIAVALAAQNILGDLFASLMIVLDKPFVVGDAITVGDLTGTVEEIGVKTTRIRSSTGEQIIFPNADLLQSRVRNFKRMFERRVLLAVGVTYETPLEKLKEIPDLMRGIISKHEPKVRIGRAHFVGFGNSALNYEAEYWIQTPDGIVFMDIQQEVGFELIRKFAERGIDFAYPTQRVLTSSE